SFTGLWNPPYLRSTLSVTTSSQVTLLYNGILYVNRTVTSAVDIDGVAGTRISVNNGSSVYWTFYVKIEIPSILSHHTFNASLPADWVPVSVVDSYPMDVTANIFYANGILTVPESVASTKGWWFFNFSAQNYVTTHNIEVFRNGEWISSSEVYANEMIRINTSLLGNPTTGNITLSIYAPNGGLWYNISTTPSGNIISFGPITMDPSNSSGGAYISRIYWSNSTEAGLFEREFVVVHKTSISMELPYDAQLTNKSAAAYNSTVAIAIRYTDIDSNVPVSGATVYYNVIGTGIYDTMKEVSPGIYKDPDGLDTSYLPSAGTYTVNITATCRGFITRNINLILEVTYPTIMDIAEAPIISGLWNSTVYLHINYTLINGTGVTGATVKLNVSSGIYTVSEVGNGLYNISLNLSSFAPGSYKIEVSANKTLYEKGDYVMTLTVAPLDSLLSYTAPDPTRFGDVVRVNITYVDVSRGTHISNSSGRLKFNLTRGGSPVSFSVIEYSNNYQLLIQTTQFHAVGNIMLELSSQWIGDTNVGFYDNETLIFAIQIVQRETLLNYQPPSPAEFDRNASVMVEYRDVNGTPISGAQVSLISPAVPYSVIDYGNGSYLITCRAYDLVSVPGHCVLHIRASWSGEPFYMSSDSYVTVAIISPSMRIEYVSPEPIPYTFNGSVLFSVSDARNGSAIFNNTGQLKIYVASYQHGTDWWIVDNGNGTYTVILNSTTWGIGAHSITIFFNWTGPPYYVNMTVLLSFSIRNFVMDIKYNSTAAIIGTDVNVSLIYTDISAYSNVPDASVVVASNYNASTDQMIDIWAEGVDYNLTRLNDRYFITIKTGPGTNYTSWGTYGFFVRMEKPPLYGPAVTYVQFSIIRFPTELRLLNSTLRLSMPVNTTVVYAFGYYD
ncbi:MAG: hypothetical protein QXR13_03295, partial [Candidatus Bathyarchaeia archaeon]